VLLQREGGLTLKQQAVLFRTGHHSAALELELTRRNIPFVKFGGLKFLEAAHVKDLLAVLRWAQNPRSALAGYRVAMLVPGIGPKAARRLVDGLAAAGDPAQALREFEPPPNARSEWQALVDLLTALGDPQSHWPDELAAVLAWYAPQLQRLHADDAAVRQLDLDQLQRLAAGHGSRERFLTELTLDPPEATSDQSGPPHPDEDYLILSTIHSAKGQEWNAVSILNVVDGCMPADLATGSAAAVAEERRLLYVAMTRAKQHLQLMVPLRFHVSQQHRHGDRHLYGGLSRFIPPEVAALFERVTAAVPATPGASPLRADDMPPPRATGPMHLGSAWD
jgi:DNA helicase II / ATP-dependent DNA helicase PcrA